MLVKQAAGNRPNFHRVMLSIERSVSNGKKGIVFDLDGALADSRQANVQSVLALFREWKIPVLQSGRKLEEICSGSCPRSVIARLAPKKLPEAEISEMASRLSQIAPGNIHLIQKTPLVEMLMPLREKGVRLSVATNRDGSTGAVLSCLEIAHHFNPVMTSLDAPPKPDPKMLHLALQRMQVSPQEAIFVGDNRSDLLAGKAAGVFTILVKW